MSKMTAATAAVDELCADELGTEGGEQINDASPDGEARKQAHQQRVRSWASVGGRIQDVAVLSVIAAVQLGWLAAITYGVFLLS